MGNPKKKNIIDPNKNIISLFDTDILVMAVKGQIDLNELAKEELRNRGLDDNGKWVGFK